MKTRIAKNSGRAIHSAIVWLKYTPRVLGKISVYWSMANVNSSENSQIHRSPNNSSNSAPATDAPIVCAAVFRIRITAIGRSILVLNPRQIAPIPG